MKKILGKVASKVGGMPGASKVSKGMRKVGGIGKSMGNAMKKPAGIGKAGKSALGGAFKKPKF